MTAELEFSLRPTRPVHQDVQFCLADGRPADVDPSRGVWRNVSSQWVCFVYPGADLAKYDSTEVAFGVGPVWGRRYRLPDLLPKSEWVHVALQVRPDGQVSLHLNRERVATSPARVTAEPRAQWMVIVSGAAVGTRVLIRNLRVWPEARYPAT